MTACIFVCAVGMLDGNEGDRGVYASDSLEATLAAKAGDMDTRHVEEFLILSKTLNYTTAAQEAFIARPTLVEHIAELEGEIGCVLFSKCEGKLSLTPIGRRFVRTASLLLDRVECIVEEYRSLPDNFLSVRIASTNLPWLESYAYKACRALRERSPKKIVEIVSVAGPSSTVDALLDGSNDIVVSGFKSWRKDSSKAPFPDGISGFRLQSESIMLLMTEGNPLFAKKKLQAADLDGADIVLPPDIYRSYIRDGVAERFRERGAVVTMRPLSFGDHFEYFAGDFSESFGVVPATLIPRFGIDRRTECRAFELEDLRISTEFYVLYRDDFLEDETASLFVEELKAMAK